MSGAKIEKEKKCRDETFSFFNYLPFVGLSVGDVVGSCVGFLVGAIVMASGATHIVRRGEEMEIREKISWRRKLKNRCWRKK